MKGYDSSDILKKASWLFCLFAFFTVVFSEVAYADAVATTTSGGGIETVLCNVVKQLQGGIGKAIATIAIIVLGIGLFMGKLSWPLAVVTAIGIGMIFGAASIVEWVSSGTGEDASGFSCN